ncbi:Uncharacterised protein [Legionella busanensis]|uniref:Uncharacterized protein n=1 Tax=Legionella busanensis TaxID=190655 RepID=A0A378JJL1_9GAMM|nr:hypothetical protein [Legionella busanensis]STX51506.1 Uncharacterised protein [Legionella busanensis]
MVHIVIAGGGPSGLYLGDKLSKKGINDILILDPRAGNYSRPGAVDVSIFTQAEKGLQAVLPPAKSDHIRNIEKSLYQYSLSQNIRIERKQFVRFSEGTKGTKGVIVAYKNKDNKLIEELIPCDYVFDCTGSKRVLVSEINKIHELRGTAKPFELTPVSKDVAIKNHLIAYIKLDQNTISLADHSKISQNNLLFNRTTVEYTRAIEKLRQFGWTEFAFPYCHNTPFKDGKTCVYIECPDNLPTSQQEVWLTTVLEIVTNQPIVNIEHLISKSNHPKPYFCSFAVNPQRLNTFTYQEPELPKVVVFGDGQIEPNYILGHGIKGAFKRIDIFAEEAMIYKEKIVYLNLANYDRHVNNAIKKHEQEIIRHYQQRKSYLEQTVFAAKDYYKLAISQAINQTEINYLSKRLNEILARTAYYLIRNVTSSKTKQETFNELLTRRNLIIMHIGKLTQFEQQEARDQLQQLVGTFTKLGKEYFQKGNFSFAIKVYEEALAIYSMYREMKQQDKFNLYEEIVLIYCKLNQLKNVFAKVSEALNQAEKPSELTKKRILFHLVKATYKNLGLYQSPIQQFQILTDFVKIYQPQQNFIDNHLALSLKVELEMIKQALFFHNFSNLTLASAAGQENYMNTGPK